MSIKQSTDPLWKEAEIYHAQGLLKEARNSYMKILGRIDTSPQTPDGGGLVSTIRDRIQALENEMGFMEEGPITPEVSTEAQDLIKKLFSFSRNRETADIEGAMALAEFGQYEKALEEFHKLIDAGVLPLLAGKNILRCHMALSSPEMAITQLRQWILKSSFTNHELSYLRTFLETLLSQHRIRAQLPPLRETSPPSDYPDQKDSDILDVCSIVIPLGGGPHGGRALEWDVALQAGNKICIAVPSSKEDLMDIFQVGRRFLDMEFYCLMALFRGTGRISGRKLVTHGPKRGDYMVDITIDCASHPFQETRGPEGFLQGTPLALGLQATG